MPAMPFDEQAVFDAARRIPPGEAREAYLRQACGDNTALAERIRALLEALEGSPSFLESPPSEIGAESASTRELPSATTSGARIGQYKLLEQIGEGGMGAVWMAQQTEPVKRLVALKFIKAGMDSKQVIARFEAERQALALMDHPNIAKVLDGGTTDDGRPYFVMDLVKGAPITRYCDENHLTPRQRLELLIPVCQAVQHAHQKGIIHRDIKPSNVLVAPYDGRPVPKIIDFGVAKAAGQSLTERTLVTGFGAIIGTLEYMSPEQAELNNQDIDTRSDIYSLGVLLYELLAGSPPLTCKDTSTVGLLETLRVIRECDPARPSTKLSTADCLATLAANRGTEAAKLTKLVCGELDWIVMKAIEKERSRRYESASAFAMDMQRFLADEPVLACPASVGYRLRKFARRNTRPVLAGALVLLALLLGLAGTTWGMVRANGQQTRAEANARAALDAAAAEKTARMVAEEREAEIAAVLDFVENRLFAAARPRRQAGGLGQEVTVRQAIAASLPHVSENFRDQPLIEARLRMTLGISFAYLGDAKAAEEQGARASDLYRARLGPGHPKTLASLHNLANCYRALGRPDESLKLHQQVLTLRRASLGDVHPDTLKSMNGVANAHFALKQHEEALRLREQAHALARQKLGPSHRDTLHEANNLANSYLAVGQHEKARALYQETLRLLREKDPDHPDLLATMMNLAVCLEKLGLLDEAVNLQEETLRLKIKVLGESDPATLESMLNLSAFYAQARRHEQALELGRRTLRLLQIKPGPNHPTTLLCQGNVAAFLTDLGRDDEAVPIIDDCLRRAAGKPVSRELTPELLTRRLRIFQKKNDSAGCRATAQAWEKTVAQSNGGLFLAARMRAVTALVCTRDANIPDPERPRFARDEAEHAMKWLHKAVAAGYRDATPLQQDVDFAVLREREDFKKLLIELGASKN